MERHIEVKPLHRKMEIKPYSGSQMGLDLGCILQISTNARVYPVLAKAEINL